MRLLPLAMTMLALQGGCTGANDSRKQGPPIGTADGVPCGASMCEWGTACCLGAGPSQCFAGDAAATQACAMEYLTCDGPEDCPGAWCCLHQQPLGPGPVKALCDGQWDDAGFVSCPPGALPACRNDPECEYFGLNGCDQVEGGVLGVAGAIALCGP